MNRTIKLLSVVLVVQIALAVVVWGTPGRRPPWPATKP